MKTFWLVLLLLLCADGRAGEETLNLDDLVDSAEQWARENLDEDVLRALEGNDQERARKFFEELKRQFRGEYVVDLAALKDAARLLAPLLDQYEETAPYAIWLRTRLDYFDVAEQLRPPARPPGQDPGQPPGPAPNPTPTREREVWIAKLSERPWPPKAKTYVSRLKPVFSAEKVPPELVWVAEVESSFDPRACSPAGAAGLFQLMPATAKQYGLERWPFDERYKPDESARAAARYLRSLHSRFKNWRLALAAYNAGEGTVQRLLDKHKATTFDGISPFLPAETQLYVPKVEATVFRREGLRLSDLRPPAS
jgi:membrane-bound lytic murein transglycosylase D